MGKLSVAILIILKQRFDRWLVLEIPVGVPDQIGQIQVNYLHLVMKYYSSNMKVVYQRRVQFNLYTSETVLVILVLDKKNAEGLKKPTGNFLLGVVGSTT